MLDKQGGCREKKSLQERSDLWRGQREGAERCQEMKGKGKDLGPWPRDVVTDLVKDEGWVGSDENDLEKLPPFPPCKHNVVHLTALLMGTRPSSDQSHLKLSLCMAFSFNQDSNTAMLLLASEVTLECGVRRRRVKLRWPRRKRGG